MLAVSLFPPPNLNPNRCAEEAEMLAELIDQKSLVREMKCRRHVREEDKRRRRDANLSCVHDPDVPAARAHWRIRFCDRFDQFVDRGALKPLSPRDGDVISTQAPEQRRRG